MSSLATHSHHSCYHSLTLSVLTRTHTRTHPSHLIVIPGYSLTPLVLPSSLMRVISLIPVSTPITCLLTHSLTHSLTHMSSLCTLTHTHPHKSSHSLPRTLTHDFCYHTHSPTPMSSLCTHTSLLRERLLSLMSSLCSLECSHSLPRVLIPMTCLLTHTLSLSHPCHPCVHSSALTHFFYHTLTHRIDFTLSHTVSPHTHVITLFPPMYSLTPTNPCAPSHLISPHSRQILP